MAEVSTKRMGGGGGYTRKNQSEPTPYYDLIIELNIQRLLAEGSLEGGILYCYGAIVCSNRNPLDTPGGGGCWRWMNTSLDKVNRGKTYSSLPKL